jgi:hypothetical protein
LAHLEGLGFAVDWFDRASYRREDQAEVARLRARDDARALLIARDMPVLRIVEGGLDALLPIGEIEALGGAKVEALIGIAPSGAPIFAATTSRSSTSDRSRSAVWFQPSRPRCWPRPRRSCIGTRAAASAPTAAR